MPEQRDPEPFFAGRTVHLRFVIAGLVLAFVVGWLIGQASHDHRKPEETATVILY